MPTARLYPAAATGTDGTIYALGGVGANGALLNTVEAYNPSTDTWSTVAPHAYCARFSRCGKKGRLPGLFELKQRG
jgi:N-acetylneuraminic acid mutarotase